MEKSQNILTQFLFCLIALRYVQIKCWIKLLAKEQKNILDSIGIVKNQCILPLCIRARLWDLRFAQSLDFLRFIRERERKIYIWKNNTEKVKLQRLHFSPGGVISREISSRCFPLPLSQDLQCTFKYALFLLLRSFLLSVCVCVSVCVVCKPVPSKTLSTTKPNTEFWSQIRPGIPTSWMWPFLVRYLGLVRSNETK